jgi:hypothetical protein
MSLVLRRDVANGRIRLFREREGRPQRVFLLAKGHNGIAVSRAV